MHSRSPLGRNRMRTYHRYPFLLVVSRSYPFVQHHGVVSRLNQPPLLWATIQRQLLSNYVDHIINCSLPDEKNLLQFGLPLCLIVQRPSFSLMTLYVRMITNRILANVRLRYLGITLPFFARLVNTYSPSLDYITCNLFGRFFCALRYFRTAGNEMLLSSS